MLEKWYNFKDAKPTTIHSEFDDSTEEYHSESNQLLLCIDNKLYMGVYIEEKRWDDEKECYYVNHSIEIASYSLVYLEDEYAIDDCPEYVLFDNDFDKHEIYWSLLDTFDILLHIDLNKKENEEGEKDAVKAKSNANR